MTEKTGLALLREPFPAHQISYQTAPGFEKPCMRFLGAHDPRGYGRIGRNGKTYFTHRYFYALMVGAIPAGMDLDHLCRVRDCMEPTHLEPVTHAENCRRGIAGEVVAAMHLAKTECPSGHPYAGDNLYVGKDGARACKKCRLAANRRFYHRQKEQA
jgi:hypothetical protein